MAWDFSFSQDNTELAVQESRTVLTSDILVGHFLATPLEQIAQIGESASDVEDALIADAFDFVTDAPNVDIYAPTLTIPTFAGDTTAATDVVEQIEQIVETPPAPAGTAWNVEEVAQGRQILTPENDLLQSALGNRIDGAQQIGTRSNDTLTGTDGDDVLIGALGDDVMTGGKGADVFVFSQSSTGRDSITDFTAGEDYLYFAAETVFDLAEITITQQGDDTLLSWHRGNSEILLEQFDAAELDADSFILAAA